MAEDVAGFPFWEIEFDENGALVHGEQVDTLLAELPARGLTNLFVFSHGWNNDRAMALNSYEQFFAKMRDVLNGQGPDAGKGIGTVGIIWPSRLWADEAPPDPNADATVAPKSDADLVRDLKSVFTTPLQQQALDQMAQLLETRPQNDPTALAQFQHLMRDLASGTGGVPPEDNGEQRGLLEADPQELFTRFAQAPLPSTTGAAGADFLDLWEGAKQALRAASYWQMKNRAGIVGKAGLGPLICRLHEKNPTVNLHLVGHSFGARLVCFALAGLSPDDRGAASPVKSLAMLEGAFSHFSFCDQLPFDPNRGGGLATMQERVDGPLIALHSVHDTAVGVLYPLASSIMQQDSDEFDPQYQWGAMGHDGAQKVGAADLTLGPVGQRYPFASGAFVNLNGDDIVKAMAPISGAHSDIFHPEIAWAVLAAARVVAMP